MQYNLNVTVETAGNPATGLAQVEREAIGGVYIEGSTGKLIVMDEDDVTIDEFEPDDWVAFAVQKSDA